MTEAALSALDADDLSVEAVSRLLASLHTMPAAEMEALLADIELLEQRKQTEKARLDFLWFCKTVYPNFKEGPHHRHMAPLLHGLRDGVEPRLTVSMPPRFGKSETIAYLFVAWYLGHFPRHQIMMVTHTADLSADFGRKVRNLIDSEVYRALFPDTVVARDKSASANWSTTLGGKYLAIGIGANVAGHGADLLIGDDLVSEQAVLSSDPDKTFAQAWEYMQVGPLQRLMPGGKIVMIGTRWSVKDPIGRALQWAAANKGSTPWKEVRFPAVLPSGKSLWPEQWPIEQLLAKKEGMFPQFWAAQYMQEPTSEEGALVKREWWRVWPSDKPPKCTFILQSWDTAHGKNDSADPSGVQTWGVFPNEDEGNDQIILLDAWTGRKEFPELKKFAFDYYKEWEPDSVIIEKKAAGAPLIQEMRAIGIPVQEYTPSRGNDKRVRLNSVADIFASGMVWRPDTRWAQEVADEIAAFPGAEHDEMVDCIVGDTTIYTQRGSICIRDVRVGDRVMSHRGWRPVSVAAATGARAVYRVDTAVGALTCTANHPVHTQRGWVPAIELRRGDTIDFLSTVEASLWHSNKHEPIAAPLFITGLRIRSILSARTLNALVGRRTLHGDVWAFHNGRAPAGHHVHHKDGDATNNALGNLELLSAADHVRRHAAENPERGRTPEHLAHLASIRPAAAEWHRSAAGKEWHTAHAAESIRKPGVAKPFSKAPVVECTCSQCGDKFSSRNPKRAKYCSPRCMSRAQDAKERAAKLAADHICRNCGVLFYTVQTKAQFCCNRCRSTFGNALRRSTRVQSDSA